MIPQVFRQSCPIWTLVTPVCYSCKLGGAETHCTEKTQARHQLSDDVVYFHVVVFWRLTKANSAVTNMPGVKLKEQCD